MLAACRTVCCWVEGGEHKHTSWSCIGIEGWRLLGSAPQAKAECKIRIVGWTTGFHQTGKPWEDARYGLWFYPLSYGKYMMLTWYIQRCTVVSKPPFFCVHAKWKKKRVKQDKQNCGIFFERLEVKKKQIPCATVCQQCFMERKIWSSKISHEKMLPNLC